MNDDAPSDAIPGPRFVPVCAIGASAGGVTALQGLFRQLPGNLGLAYVVVLHLSPDQPSALSDILAGCTRMPVLQIHDGPTLRRDCVYVIPPDRELVIEGDSVTARPFSEPRGRRAPIDMFFRSIAAARGDGVAIVLSGAGADGTLGVQAVKEAGGVILVQEPAEAGFPSMPQNAIASGVADFVAPLARLAERLAEVARSKEAVRSLDMDGSANDLRRIVAFLRARTGHDFASYKRATVMRRVLRRMQVCRTDTVAAYADHLATTPDEAKELFSDLLISVTMFFRDPRAFEALERHVLKPIFDDLDPDKEESIRAWVVGCATGEEAYSLAMLLHEEAARRKVRAQFQIFASDLDEGALATAREGRYPRSIEADVSDERLARFFVDEGTHFRVRKELRESVLFATHSVLKEPPFMRLDLISCRNLLIYMERALQQQICSIFHYGLKPGRFLFLGSAETADSAPELFAPLDRDARIYGARPHASHALPILPQFSAPERFAGPGDQLALGRQERSDLPIALHVSALERTTPATALVDGAHNIVHLSPSAGRFILHSAGPVSNQLPAIVRPELRLDLRLALARALDGKEPTLTHPAIVTLDGVRRRVSMHVAPVPNGTNMGAQALVFFLDGGGIPDDASPDDASKYQPDEVRRLHAELKSAQEAVVASRAGHEASIQDLRATNEELQSINEEYRSTAEELETSKEELQSINEELHTVNAELKSKLASISVAHSDLQNLTDATEVGTLFLDADLHIKMFTPPIADLFNFTKADIGRTITDFSHHLDYEGLSEDARQVLRQLAPIEREVKSRRSRSYVMRMRPYRTIEDRIDGVVLTFFDITERLQADEALVRSEEKYRTIFNSIDEGFCVVEMILNEDGKPIDLLHLEANEAYERYTGLGDIVGKRALEIVPEGGPWLDFYGKIALTGQSARSENYLGAPINRWIASYASRIGGKDSLKVAIVFSDISERKRAEEELRESEERQAFLLRLSDSFRAAPDAEAIGVRCVDLLAEYMKLDRCFLSEMHGEENVAVVACDHCAPGLASVAGRSRYSDSPEIMRRVKAGKPLMIADVAEDASLTERDKTSLAALGIGAVMVGPLRRGDGKSIWAITVATTARRDWTRAEFHLVQDVAERTWSAMQRARAEKALRESEERFQQFANASAAALWIRDARTLSMEFASRAIETIYGIEPDAILGAQTKWAALIVPDDRDVALDHIQQARRGEVVVHEFRIQRPSDGAFRWVRNTDFPLYDPHGRVQRIGGIAEDVTEAKLAFEHQGVLLAELQHRVRNIMAIIRSITARTAERAHNVEEYLNLMMGRLLALARVQTLLTRAAKVSIGIGSIVHDEVSAQAQHDGQYVLEGTDVQLSAKAAEILTLAIHELATNALKYGAFSVPDGKVSVSWNTFDQDGTTWLRLDWVEQGTRVPPRPTPETPRRRGFGSELIEGRIPYELGGRGKVTIAPDGARCQLEFPLRNGGSMLETGAPQGARVFGGAIDMTGDTTLAGQCVLVVEDEYFLATDTARALQGAGARILGPVPTEEAARAELANERPDAVVLDINLGQGATFRLAEYLKDNGIPFMFVTGYDPDVIPAEFAEVGRLEKPLQLRQIVGAVARLLTPAT